MNITGCPLFKTEEVLMKSFHVEDPYEGVKKQFGLPTDAEKKMHHSSLYGMSKAKFLQTYPPSNFSYFTSKQRTEILKGIIFQIYKAEQNHLAANAPERQLAREKKESALKMQEVLLENGSILFVLPKKMSKNL